MMSRRPDVNYRGAEWAAVEDWLTAELQETYKHLAGLNIDEQKTQQLRGRASLIDMMLEFRHIAAD